MEGYNAVDDLNNVLLEALASVSEAGDTLQIRKPGGSAISIHSKPQVTLHIKETHLNISTSTARSQVVDAAGITALMFIVTLVMAMRQKFSASPQRSSKPMQIVQPNPDKRTPSHVELCEDSPDREKQPMESALNIPKGGSKAHPNLESSVIRNDACIVRNEAPPLLNEDHQIAVVSNPLELALQFQAAVPQSTVERELEIAEEYQRKLLTRDGPPLSREALLYARQKVAEEVELTLRCQQEARQYCYDYQQRTTDRTQACKQHKESIAAGREDKEWLKKLQEAWEKCLGYLNLAVSLRTLLPPLLRSLQIAYLFHQQGAYNVGMNILASNCAYGSFAVSTAADGLGSESWIAYGLRYASTVVTAAASVLVTEETTCIAKNACFYLMGLTGAGGLLFLIGYVSNLLGMAPYIKNTFQSLCIISLLVACNMLSLDWIQYAICTSLVCYAALFTYIQYKFTIIRNGFLKLEHAPSSQQVAQQLVSLEYVWLAPVIFTVYCIYEVARFG